MRDLGIPKLLTWRWTPCAALVLGSLSFVGFVSLAIPERIGGLVEGAKSSSFRLGNQLTRGRTNTPEPAADFPNEGASDSPTAASPVDPVTRVAQHSGNGYPRRGFSPPLDRPDAPPAPPPAPAAVVPPAPPPPPAEAPPPPAPVAAQEAAAPPAEGPQAVAVPAPASDTPPPQ